jgi:hypothetical protein
MLSHDTSESCPNARGCRKNNGKRIPKPRLRTDAESLPKEESQKRKEEREEEEEMNN